MAILHIICAVLPYFLSRFSCELFAAVTASAPPASREARAIPAPSPVFGEPPSFGAVLFGFGDVLEAVPDELFELDELEAAELPFDELASPDDVSDDTSDELPEASELSEESSAASVQST